MDGSPWPHNVPQAISIKKFLLLDVKQVKTNLQTFDFVICQVCSFVDFLEINVCVRILFASHSYTDCH